MKRCEERLMFHLNSFFKISFAAVFFCMVAHVPAVAAMPAEKAPAAAVLKKMSAFRAKNYTSVIFQFEDELFFEEPELRAGEVFIRLKNTVTALSPSQRYKTYDSWVLIEKLGKDLIVRLGLPPDFSRLSHVHTQDPQRLIIKLYKGKEPPPAVAKQNSPKATALTAPLESNGTTPAKPIKTTPAKPIKKDVKEKRTSPAKVLKSKPLTADSRQGGGKPDQIVSTAKASQIKAAASDQKQMTLNFFQADIQKVFSAIAMQNEINIVTTNDVRGKISVHLYRLSLDEALNAITLAGGFNYHKRGKLYYVYKPKEVKDPQAEKLIVRVFKLKYADSWSSDDFGKVKDILSGIPGMRTINIHESSKTIIIEDTPENIKKIEAIIGFWDTMPRQVMIEAQILEITLTDDMSFGVDWSKALGGGGQVQIGTGGLSTATLPTATTGIVSPVTASGIFANMITGIGTSSQFAMALDALRTQTDVNTLSMPKILAIHGKEATVKVGGEQGYPETTTTETSTTQSFKFIDTGTILVITPYIDNQNNILLDVQPTIKSVTLGAGGTPTVAETSVSTRLLVMDGQTIFIGGLIRKQQTKSRTGIPCLGGLPGFGAAFRRDVTGGSKTELVILITPQILEPALKSLDQEEAKDKVRETGEKLDKENEKNKEPIYKRVIK